MLFKNGVPLTYPKLRTFGGASVCWSDIDFSQPSSGIYIPKIEKWCVPINWATNSVHLCEPHGFQTFASREPLAARRNSWDVGTSQKNGRQHGESPQQWRERSHCRGLQYQVAVIGHHVNSHLLLSINADCPMQSCVCFVWQRFLLFVVCMNVSFLCFLCTLICEPGSTGSNQRIVLVGWSSQWGDRSPGDYWVFPSYCHVSK